MLKTHIKGSLTRETCSDSGCYEKVLILVLRAQVTQIARNVLEVVFCRNQDINHFFKNQNCLMSDSGMGNEILLWIVIRNTSDRLIVVKLKKSLISSREDVKLNNLVLY